MGIQVELDLIAKKLKLDLKENEIPCPTCHGVRLIEKQINSYQ